MSFPFTEVLTMIVLLLLKDAVNVRGSAEQKPCSGSEVSRAMPMRAGILPS